jgi:hypothetical protein
MADNGYIYLPGIDKDKAYRLIFVYAYSNNNRIPELKGGKDGCKEKGYKIKEETKPGIHETSEHQ